MGSDDGLDLELSDAKVRGNGGHGGQRSLPFTGHESAVSDEQDPLLKRDPLGVAFGTDHGVETDGAKVEEVQRREKEGERRRSLKGCVSVLILL